VLPGAGPVEMAWYTVLPLGSSTSWASKWLVGEWFDEAVWRVTRPS